MKDGEEIMEEDNHSCCNHIYDDGQFEITLTNYSEVGANDYCEGIDDFLDFNVNCTDIDNTLASVLHEDYEAGYNVMTVTCNGEDTLFQSGVQVKSEKGETRVFIQALKANKKYGQNIIPVFTTENDFEKWMSQKGNFHTTVK